MESKYYSVDYQVKTNRVVIQGVSVVYTAKVELPNEYEPKTKIMVEFSYLHKNLEVNFPRMSEKFMMNLEKNIVKTIERFVSNQIEEGFSYPSIY